MYIETFANSTELSSMRNTLFYKKLRPYIHERLAANTTIHSMQIREENEAKLSVEDRYFVKLDILFGQLFKNCKTRQLWKQFLLRLRDDEGVSCLSIETLEKAYLNELVVLFERLGRFTTLLRKAFRSDIDVTDMEVRLLAFFNPLLFTKRNYSHHRLYIGFPGLTELQLLEEKVTDKNSFNAYYSKYEEFIDERLGWVTYTEQEIAGLLKDFLESLHAKLEREGVYIEPKFLSPEFSISERLEVDIRKRHDHKKIFAESNSNKANNHG